MVLRGVNISDPDKLEQNKKWTKAYFTEVKKFGANVIRIPVHPVSWRNRGADNYFELLDQAVVWANELDLYLIIDWHSIGNLDSGVFQHAMYFTSKQETFNFWRDIAFRYQGVSTIAVYELFNEPTNHSGKWGTLDWSTWKAINEQMITIIYAHDKKVIPLVAGFNWAYDLSHVKQNPIKQEGVAYAIHPYPQKTGQPWEKNWENQWGYLAKKYPLIATEIGFMRSDMAGAHVPVIDDTGTYGPTIVKYLAERQISWVVWNFDPDWPPQVITDWDYNLTLQGQFFHKVLVEKTP